MATSSQQAECGPTCCASVAPHYKIRKTVELNLTFKIALILGPRSGVNCKRLLGRNLDMFILSGN